MSISKAKMGRNIRAAREKRGMSMEEMAKRMGESEECVMKLEKGRKYVSLSMLLSICTALDAAADELLDDVLIKHA